MKMIGELDYNENRICIVKTDDLLDAISTAYKRGHDDTLDESYCDPFDVYDIAINFCDDLIRRGILDQSVIV